MAAFFQGVPMSSLKPLAVAVSGLFVLTPALAADVVQKVKPPVSQAYLDLATFSGGMPAMAGSNAFGQTQGQSQGRWMDVVLLTRNNPNLKAATQSVPAGSRLAPTLNLLAPEPQMHQAPERDVVDDGPAKFEMPKGKMYLYWGCGTEVRKGQPLVIDFARMDVTQYNKFFQNRGATSRVPTPVPGRPAWPNKTDARLLPDGASMAGEHAFAGDGVVDGFKFNIDAAHDLMPAVEATRSDDGKGVLFKWKPMQQATAWFVQAMGMRDTAGGGGGEMELVYWTSSELPDMGMGLVNYQPDSAIDKWRKEKVLLPAGATECAAPKEAVGATAMSRVIAYGDELNMAWPPRPKDPKVTWEPQWDVKVRRKSVASLMPGMDAMAMSAAMSGHDADADGRQPAQPAPSQVKMPTATDVITQSAFGLLRGVFKK
jgi:hypothetical protein